MKQRTLQFLIFIVLTISPTLHAMDDSSGAEAAVVAAIERPTTLESVIDTMVTFHHERARAAQLAQSSEYKISKRVSYREKRKLSAIITGTAPSVVQGIITKHQNVLQGTPDTATLLDVYKALEWARVLIKFSRTKPVKATNESSATSAAATAPADSIAKKRVHKKKSEKKKSDTLSEIAAHRKAIRNALIRKEQPAPDYSDEDDTTWGDDKKTPFYEYGKRKATHTVAPIKAELERVTVQSAEKKALKEKMAKDLEAARTAYEEKRDKKDAPLTTSTGGAEATHSERAKVLAWKALEEGKLAEDQDRIDALSKEEQELSAHAKSLERELALEQTKLYLARVALKRMELKNNQAIKQLKGDIGILESDITAKQRQFALSPTTEGLQEALTALEQQLANKKATLTELNEKEKDLTTKIAAIETPRSAARQLLKNWGVVS